MSAPSGQPPVDPFGPQQCDCGYPLLGLNTSRCPECGRVQTRLTERAREAMDAKKRLQRLQALFGCGTLLLLAPVLVVASSSREFKLLDVEITTFSLVFMVFVLGFLWLLTAGEAIASSQWSSAMVATIGLMLLLLVAGCCSPVFFR